MLLYGCSVTFALLCYFSSIVQNAFFIIQEEKRSILMCRTNIVLTYQVTRINGTILKASSKLQFIYVMPLLQGTQDDMFGLSHLILLTTTESRRHNY